MPTTMMFAPSKDGHSHCEEAFSSVEEYTKTASAVLNAVLKQMKNTTKKIDATKSELTAN